VPIRLTPVRLKCAILGLTTLKMALHKSRGTPLPAGPTAADARDFS
jgi:NifU-like protein involved in Fe-S cluster formation